MCIDKFDVDPGHRELAEAGITDNIVIPWMLEGLGFDAPLEKKQDSLKRFADTYIHSGLAGLTWPSPILNIRLTWRASDPGTRLPPGTS